MNYTHNEKCICRKIEKLNCLSASLTKSQKNNDGNKWMNHGNSSLLILFLSLDIFPNILHISWCLWKGNCESEAHNNFITCELITLLLLKVTNL